MSDFGPLFNYRPMKDLVNYLSSYNNATQALANKSTGADPDLKTTGTAQGVVNGVHIASLPANATIDLSDGAVAVPDPLLGTALAGMVMADNAQFYLLVAMNIDGDAKVYLASNIADNVAPDLKIPAYDPQFLCVGLDLWDNDALGAAATIGTSVKTDADDTFTQLVGPNLLPHIDLWDKN